MNTDDPSLYGLNGILGDVGKKRNSNDICWVVPPVKRRKPIRSPTSVGAGEDTSSSLSRLQSNLPCPKQHNGTPTAFLCDLFEAMHGIRLHVKKSSELGANFFQQVSEEQIAAYTTEIVNFVRENNVEKLRALHEENPSRVHCANQFGESLLHRACRLGLEEMTSFLLQDANVTVRIADDCGRNPLHDTCWNPTPQLQICAWLMKRDPSLFLIADMRGFSPFDYARSHHWLTWKEFLYENRRVFDKLVENQETLSMFSKEEPMGCKTLGSSP
jgi:hypothetical protein